jgi:hypothetical protein
VGAPTRHEGPGKPLYNSIRRLFFAEHWKVGTIAAELGLSAYLNEALGRECIPLATLQHDLPAGVAPILSSWLESAEFRRLREELQAIRRSLETYGAGPFVTVDAVTVDAVVQAAGTCSLCSGVALQVKACGRCLAASWSLARLYCAAPSGVARRLNSTSVSGALSNSDRSLSPRQGACLRDDARIEPAQGG